MKPTSVGFQNPFQIRSLSILKDFTMFFSILTFKCLYFQNKTGFEAENLSITEVSALTLGWTFAGKSRFSVKYKRISLQIEKNMVKSLEILFKRI